MRKTDEKAKKGQKMSHSVNEIQSICVFMGASEPSDPVYHQAAEELAAFIVSRNLTLVYGGGSRGMMFKIANEVKKRGGRVIGVIPKSLVKGEYANEACDELHVVESMHERKFLMCKLSDCIMTFPGGVGTMDEICEIITWNQLDIIRKPCGFLNVNGFFDHFFAFLAHMNKEGFIKKEHLELYDVDVTPQALFEKFLHKDLSPVGKWKELEKEYDQKHKG